MNSATIYQIIATAVILMVGLVLRGIASSSLDRKVKTQGLKPQSGVLARKIVTAFIVIAVVITVGLVWGVGPRSIWVSLTGILTLVVIGFFAVWCILSNVVAGLILLISRPFDIGDEVLFLPENVQGTVTNITSLFLVLKDSEGSPVTIPNNYVFQRIVKKVEKKNAE